MFYYVVLYDKNLKPIGQAGQKPQPVSDFKLKQKAVEFDEADIDCREVQLSDEVMYAGLHLQDGTLLWLGFAGLPISKDGKTTIYGEDLRRIFDQEAIIDLRPFGDPSDTGHYHKLVQLVDYLLKIPQSLPQASLVLPSYSVDLSDFIASATASKWKDGVVDCTSVGKGNVWQAIQALCSWYRLVIVTSVERLDNGGLGISFKVEPIVDEVAVNLAEAGATLKSDLTSTNSATVCDADGKNATTFFLLTTGDVVQESQLSSNLSDVSGSAAHFATDQKKLCRDFLAVPLVSKVYPRDKDKGYDQIKNGTTDDSSGVTVAFPDNDKAMEDGLKALANARDKSKVKVDVLKSAYTKKALASMLWDEDAAQDVVGVDPAKALRMMGVLYGYYKASPAVPKLLPVMEVDREPNKLSVSFGRLSDYWFVN